MVAFEQNLTLTDVEDMGQPQMKSVTHIFITILFVYFISCRRLKSLDWSLRLSLIICLLGTVVSLVVVMSNTGTIEGLQRMVGLDIDSITKVESWIAAIRRVTEGLKIASGGHVLLGSYMTIDTPSHFRVCYLVGYYMMVLCLFYVHYFFVESLLRCKLNMGSYGVDSADGITFVTYPTVLGLTATPQLWSTLFFLIYWILSVISIVLHVMLAEETLAEEFKISDYYKYTRCCMCFVIFLLTLPLTTNVGLIVARVITHELKIINLFVITLIFIVLFMYNIQRLNDDIHFVLNVPPTWYVQTCWIATAFISGIMFFYQVWQYASDNKYYMIRLPMYLLLGIPILFGFGFKTIQYVKIRNITGMFRPSVYYGAPDINTRIMRLLYNPRLEVRYRRRRETCKHRCLLNSEIAMEAIGREIALLYQIAHDLHTNEEYKEEFKDIITKLQKHHEFMRERFMEFPNS